MSDLTNVLKNKNEQLLEVIMLMNRGIINKKIEEKNIKELVDTKITYLDESKITINISTAEIKNISSGSAIDEYLSDKIDYKKFLIVKNFSKKVYKQINKIYKNCEIFFFHEFLEVLPDKDFIPQHILLSEDEKNELQKTFNLKDLSKIYDTDKMARYYGAKVNDIFKIVRININSGYSTAYRYVVPGNTDYLFV